MKKQLFKKLKWLNLFLVFMLVLTPVSYAQEEGTSEGFMLGIEEIPGLDDALNEFSEVSPIDIELGFSLVSAYMWRGQKLGGDTSWQAYVTISPDFEPIGDISMGFWVDVTKGGAGGNGDKDIEWDWWVEYGFSLSELTGEEDPALDASITSGYIYYHFPHLNSRTQEIYFGISLDTLLNPSFTWYHDWNQGKGEWLEFGISHDVELEGITVATYATLGYNHNQWAASETHRFSTLDFGASIPIPIGEHMTIEPFLSYTKRLSRTYVGPGADLTEDELYGGFNYSIAF